LEELKKVSLSTTIKNRLWLFKQALPTWLKYDFKNIYILDWNSEDGEELENFVKSLNDSRIILQTAKGKRTHYFMAAISRNISAERCIELTKPEYLLQIDCDCKINASINNLRLYKDIIYFAPWTKFLHNPFWEENDLTFDPNPTPEKVKIIHKNRQKYGTYGTVLFPLEKVWKYGYYNENLTENNLFDTLHFVNYFQGEDHDNIWYFRDEIEHIDHSGDSRMSEGQEMDMVRALMINRALRILPPYRHKYTVNNNIIEIN
jgi:hypothetical protein